MQSDLSCFAETLWFHKMLTQAASYSVLNELLKYLNCLCLFKSYIFEQSLTSSFWPNFKLPTTKQKALKEEWLLLDSLNAPFPRNLYIVKMSPCPSKPQNAFWFGSEWSNRFLKSHAVCSVVTVQPDKGIS